MSLTYGFYNSLNGDRKYNAIQMSSIFDGIITDGVLATIGDGMLVKAKKDLTVTVGIGRAWFDHTWSYNDALYPITLSPAHVLLPRYDAIVLEVNNEEAVRANSFKIVEGTPANSPEYPSLIKDELVKQYPLAYILRGAASDSVSQGDIVNTVGTSACPFAAGVLKALDVTELYQQWEGKYNQYIQTRQDSMDSWMDAEKKSMSDWEREQKASFSAWEKDQKDGFEAWYAMLYAQFDESTFKRFSDKVDDFEARVSAVEAKPFPQIINAKDVVEVNHGNVQAALDADDVANASGESLSLKTGDGSIKIRKVVGKTKKSKNLLGRIPLIEGSKAGVKCTNNGDGTYTVQGTATANIWMILDNKLSLPSGRYKLVALPNGETTRFGLWQNNQTRLAENGELFALSEATSNIFVDLEIVKGKNYNFTLKPMIVDANLYPDATYDDFEPYGLLTSGSMGCVDLGDLDWEKIRDGAFRTYDNFINNAKRRPLGNNVYSNEYTPFDKSGLSWADWYNANNIYGIILNPSNVSTGNLCIVLNPKYKNVADFKQAMKGHYLAYELADGATPSQYAEVVETRNSDNAQKNVAIIPLSEPLYESNVISEDGVTKKYACVDLGDLDWEYATNPNRFTAIFNDIKYVNTNVPINAYIDKYDVYSFDSSLTKDKAISAWGNSSVSSNITIIDSSLGSTKKPSGLLVYELATPTTDPLTPAQFEVLKTLKSFEGGTFIDTSDEYAKAELHLEYGTKSGAAKALAQEINTKNKSTFTSVRGSFIELDPAVVGDKVLVHSYLKNLFVPIASEIKQYGITMTLRSDGVLIANGTATSGDNIKIGTVREDGIDSVTVLNASKDDGSATCTINPYPHAYNGGQVLAAGQSTVIPRSIAKSIGVRFVKSVKYVNYPIVPIVTSVNNQNGEFVSPAYGIRLSNRPNLLTERIVTGDVDDLEPGQSIEIYENGEINVWGDSAAWDMNVSVSLTDAIHTDLLLPAGSYKFGLLPGEDNDPSLSQSDIKGMSLSIELLDPVTRKSVTKYSTGGVSTFTISEKLIASVTFVLESNFGSVRPSDDMFVMPFLTPSRYNEKPKNAMSDLNYLHYVENVSANSNDSVMISIQILDHYESDGPIYISSDSGCEFTVTYGEDEISRNLLTAIGAGGSKGVDYSKVVNNLSTTAEGFILDARVGQLIPQTYHGTSAPSNSLGKDGDIYIMTS